MRHATPSALDQLEPLLEELRVIVGFNERKRGTFYRKSSAFLHFHEDQKGLFADLKVDGEWKRLAVNTSIQRQRLLERAQRMSER